MEEEIFDRARTIERVENDIELLRELIALCKKEFSLKLPELKNSVEHSDCDAVIEVAHFLKSSFGNVGATRAFSAAAELEAACKRGEVFELGKLLESLEKSAREFFRWAETGI